jgi:hypothetical protein
VHLAWTSSDVDFSLQVWRQALDLRPALAATWRALCDGDGMVDALRGPGRYPRPASLCGRLLRVLCELELVELERRADGSFDCRLVERPRTELERSPSYGAYRDRLAGIEGFLSGALPEQAAVRPRAAVN